MKWLERGLRVRAWYVQQSTRPSVSVASGLAATKGGPMTPTTDRAWKAVLGRVENVGFHPLDTKAVYEFVVTTWREGDALELDYEALSAQILEAGGSEEWVSFIQLALQYGLPVLDAQAES